MLYFSDSQVVVELKKNFNKLASIQVEFRPRHLKMEKRQFMMAISGSEEEDQRKIIFIINVRESITRSFITEKLVL